MAPRRCGPRPCRPPPPPPPPRNERPAKHPLPAEPRPAAPPFAAGVAYIFVHIKLRYLRRRRSGTCIKIHAAVGAPAAEYLLVAFATGFLVVVAPREPAPEGADFKEVFAQQLFRTRARPPPPATRPHAGPPPVPARRPPSQQSWAVSVEAASWAVSVKAPYWAVSVKAPSWAASVKALSWAVCWLSPGPMCGPEKLWKRLRFRCITSWAACWQACGADGVRVHVCACACVLGGGVGGGAWPPPGFGGGAAGG